MRTFAALSIALSLMACTSLNPQQRLSMFRVIQQGAIDQQRINYENGMEQRRMWHERALMQPTVLGFTPSLVY